MKNCLLLLGLLLVTFTAGAQQTPLQTGLSLKYLVQAPAAGIKNPPVIVLLHGYGSDERDLFELRSALPNNYLIVSARAPYDLPNGGYEWYEGQKGQHDGNPAQISNSRKLIEQFIREIVSKYQADGKKVFLVGFSQGAIMSYEVGLTDPAVAAGIAPLSGMIFGSLKPQIVKTRALQQLKIFIGHGTADNRIPFADAEQSAAYLAGIGLKPAFHHYEGMGHSISKEELSDLVEWLK